MGIWGTLAVMALVILMSVAVGNVTDMSPGTVERVDTLEGNDGPPREDDRSPVDCDGAVEDQESRQISVGDDDTTELPRWTRYIFIVFLYALPAVMIHWQTPDALRRRAGELVETLDVSGEWVEMPRSSNKGPSVSQVLLVFSLAGLLPMGLTMMNPEWFFNLFIGYIIAYFAVFIYILYLPPVHPLERSGKRTDVQYELVVMAVERAIGRRGLTFHRHLSGRLRKKRASKELLKIQDQVGSGDPDGCFYELDDRILQVRDWSRGQETRVNIVIFYDGEEDGLRIDGLKREIDLSLTILVNNELEDVIGENEERMEWANERSFAESYKDTWNVTERGHRYQPLEVGVIVASLFGAIWIPLGIYMVGYQQINFLFLILMLSTAVILLHLAYLHILDGCGEVYRVRKVKNTYTREITKRDDVVVEGIESILDELNIPFEEQSSDGSSFPWIIRKISPFKRIISLTELDKCIFVEKSEYTRSEIHITNVYVGPISEGHDTEMKALLLEISKTFRRSQGS